MICYLQAGDPGEPVCSSENERANGVLVPVRAREDRCPNSKPGRETEFPFSAFLFYSGPGLVGRGPPTWGRDVCLPSQLIQVLILSRNTLTDTLANV